MTDQSTRCTVPLGKPDTEGGCRTHEPTELLVDKLELGVLWDKYGIVRDIVVSLLSSYSFKFLSSAFISTIGACLFILVCQYMHSVQLCIMWL